jgi:hypothetical protein
MSDSAGNLVLAHAIAPHAAEPLPLSQLLAQIVEDYPGDRLSLSQLASLLRDRAWGGLLLIFAAINVLPLPPGASTITGIPLVILTAQMALGRTTPWFPKRIEQRGISKDEIARLMARLLPWERRIERILKPRFAALTSHRAARLIGIVSFLLSVILWLPIPLGNHAPALSMTLFAAALIYRDGLLVMLGALAALGSVVLVSLTFTAAWFTFVMTMHALFPG